MSEMDAPIFISRQKKSKLKKTISARSTLHQCVSSVMQTYFAQLDGQPTSHVYEMVIAEVEMALFEAVMDHAEGNQTTAAAFLGISRGTLRKKLKQYQLD